MRRQLGIAACFSGVLLMGALSSARQTQNGNAEPGKHWVSTWAASQQMVRTAPAAGRGTSAPQSGAQGATTPINVPPGRQPVPFGEPLVQPDRPEGLIPASLNDQTVRMVAHTSIGGRRVRVQLANAISGSELVIGAAHIAVRAKASEIVLSTDRVLTFSGQPTYRLQPGAIVFSDPVDLPISPQSDVAVSVYVPEDSGVPANHSVGLHTTYVSKGDTTSRQVMPDPGTSTAYFWLSSIDVLVDRDAFAVVALGDSITDGYRTTRDADRAWPQLLAKRLLAHKATADVAVVNEGISGNRILSGPSSVLVRFEHDVLSVPGAKWVILLIGINDINANGRSAGPARLSSDDLVAAYRQVIERAHTHGLKVIGATITPEEGLPQPEVFAKGEAIRDAVNQWIRTSKSFDAVVDFDAAVRDPDRPARLRPAFDPGDHIHPNDAGNQAMADAFSLATFTK